MIYYASVKLIPLGQVRTLIESAEPPDAERGAEYNNSYIIDPNDPPSVTPPSPVLNSPPRTPVEDPTDDNTGQLTRLESLMRRVDKKQDEMLNLLRSKS